MNRSILGTCLHEIQAQKHTVEPVFGIIKTVMGFLMRGVESVRGESMMGYNAG
ncbi:MAG TPA: hypothetical protein VKN62_13100 [Pelovirga sp.]|nr:hypothetical protein [Pelovirga sp.]